ncbi:MAG: M20 family metallopeptidase [Nitrososphaerota archaeon]
MAVQGLESYIASVAAQLVRINTENPPGRELEAARFVAERTAEMGMRTTVLDHGGGRGSTLAVLDSGNPGPSLMFNSHLDTVPAGSPEDWEFHPFEGGVSGGMLRGRGSVDAKGCLAAMLAGVKMLGDVRCGSLVLAAVADEEVGGLGTVQVCRQLKRVDYAVFGEPTAMKLLLGNRGRGEMVIEVRGSPAHASTPEVGVNAIMLASRIVMRLAALEKGFGRRHSLLGRNTASVTMVSGGLKSNVIADRCTLVVDFRTVPGAIVRDLEEVIRGRVAGIPAALRITSYTPPAITRRDSPLVKAAGEALRAAGLRVRMSGMRSTTDYSILLKHHRADGVILGPGDLSVAHSFRESVPIRELVRAAHVYRGIAERLLNQPK